MEQMELHGIKFFPSVSVMPPKFPLKASLEWLRPLWSGLVLSAVALACYPGSGSLSPLTGFMKRLSVIWGLMRNVALNGACLGFILGQSACDKPQGGSRWESVCLS